MAATSNPSQAAAPDAQEFTVPQPEFPERFKTLVKIEDKIVSSIDLCGDAMDELQKMGQADKDTAAQLCKQFLENMRDIKSELHQLIITTPTVNTNRTSDYVAKFAANAADKKVQVTLERLNLIEAALSGARKQQDGIDGGAGADAAVAGAGARTEVKAEAEQPGADAAAGGGSGEANEDAMVIG